MIETKESWLRRKGITVIFVIISITAAINYMFDDNIKNLTVVGLGLGLGSIVARLLESEPDEAAHD